MGCPTALPRPQIKTYSSWTYIYKDQKTKELSFRLLRLQNLEYWWNSTKSIWNFPLIFDASVRPQTPASDFGRFVWFWTLPSVLGQLRPIFGRYCLILVTSKFGRLWSTSYSSFWFWRVVSDFERLIFLGPTSPWMERLRDISGSLIQPIGEEDLTRGA